MGRTGRTVDHRVKEHQRGLTYDYTTSAVAEHAQKENHDINWRSEEILDDTNNFRKRCYLKAGT